MNTLNVGYENTVPIDLHYEDIGDGKPAILVHGWPIDSIFWTHQARALRKAGLRVISYDRRGFGKSSRPSGGYDYDTLADDLHHIVSTLDLHDVTLVGFTSGCGEIFRYLGTYGSERICKSAFVSPLPPSPQKSIANPIVNFTEELDSLRQTQITEALDAIQSFTQNFLEELESNTSQTGEIFLQFISRTMHSISLAMDISGINTWATDFTDDLRRIAIPTLVIHGDADRITPLESSARTLNSLLANSKIHIIKNGQHCLPLTNAEQLNALLIDFIGA